eukprot:2922218-Karenia_brevis.AAC.1
MMKKKARTQSKTCQQSHHFQSLTKKKKKKEKREKKNPSALRVQEPILPWALQKKIINSPWRC